MSGGVLTVLASAVSGALAGGVVSWVAAPQLIGRQQRGAARSEARTQIRTLVSPVLTNVRQYSKHARGSMARDPEESQIHADDLVLCASVLSNSANLGRVRRWAVQRRLRRLFGANTVDLCETHGDDAMNPKASIGILINRQYMAKQHAGLEQPDTGQFDRALRCDPDSPEVAALERSLGRLVNCY
ncbi:hypothetical protein [Mycolicibacterium sp. GESEQ-9]|uniref:hypothetical protein n=1 Tax=Mycolicibacterium sp. GESEQ-9 TaxID=2812656 RepID=UPI001B32A313|nr:hypothetical protein [Mycolicibacterium sp. GESEQ-9]